VPILQDNTIRNPDFISLSPVTGQGWLVPPLNALGLWEGHEDEVAYWNGGGWNFVTPPEGAEYIMATGPNAGRVYTRTAITDARINVVPLGELDATPVGNAAWTLVSSGGSTAEWNAGDTSLRVIAPAGTKTAYGKVVFPVLNGTAYEARIYFYDLDVDVPNNEIVKYTLRNETTSTDIVTANVTANGEVLVPFVAGGTSYSIKITAQTTSSPNLARGQVDYIRVKRQAEMVKSGNFETGTVSTDWSWPSPPWAVSGGKMVGSINETVTTLAVQQTGGGLGVGPPPPFYLNQTVTGLSIGTFYRISFLTSGTWSWGRMTLWVDSLPLLDVASNGIKEYYFRATATSHVISFPLTATPVPVGPYPITSMGLDDASMRAALWISPRIVTGVAAGISGASCGTSRGWRAIGTANGISGGTCGTKCTRTLSGIANAVSAAVGRLTKGSTKLVTGTGNAVSSAVCIPARIRFVSGIANGVSGAVCQTVDTGAFTVKMAIDSIVTLWSNASAYCGCNDDGTCTPLQMEALEKLNAAMQNLHASGKDWGYVSNTPLTIAAASNVLVLPKNVLHVKRLQFEIPVASGSGTTTKLELRPLKSRHELEAWQTSRTKNLWPLTAAEVGLKPYQLPLAYFVEAEDLRDGSTGGPPALRVLLAPAVTVPWNWSVNLQVGLTAPRYFCRHLHDGAILDIPQRFAETLLLPLARYYALSSRHFRQTELRDQVIQQASEVLSLLGEMQPVQPEAAKTDKSTTTKGGRR